MDRAQALKYIRNGVIAAVISGVMTTFVVLAALLSSGPGPLDTWRDPSNLFDIALIFACAWGIKRRSRFAAVLMLAYFVTAKVIITFQTGRADGLIFGAVFLWFFARAVQGTFAFHRIERAENPDYKPTARWKLYTGIPVLLVIVALLGFGLMTVIGVVPPNTVQAGHEVHPKHRDLLVEHGVLEPDERIEYLCAFGFTSVLDSGAALTDRRVVVWATEEGELGVWNLYHEEITRIELVEPGSLLVNAAYRIVGDMPNHWIIVELSTDNGGDTRFIDALRARTGAPLR